MDSLVFARAPAPSAALPGAGIPLSVADNPTPPKLTLAALFAAEESGLLRFALGLSGRRSVAEDLVQEAFLRLHQSWADVENPRAWLYRTVRNLALNHLRDRRPETEFQDESSPREAPLPAELLSHHEAIGHIRLLLAELPPEDRDLIRLRYHDDLKYDQISQRTGLTVGNVGYRLHHLLKSLADSLRRAGIEDSHG
jgi:RNA polymerase sigma factor (sigma-70 family)